MDAVEHGDVQRVGPGGGEAVGEGGVVLRGGEDGVGGIGRMAAEAADPGEVGLELRVILHLEDRRAGDACGPLLRRVVGPGAGDGEPGGEVGREQRLADAGLADDQRQAAERQAVRPEPADALRRGFVEEALHGRERGGRVVIVEAPAGHAESI